MVERGTPADPWRPRPASAGAWRSATRLRAMLLAMCFSSSIASTFRQSVDSALGARVVGVHYRLDTGDIWNLD
jgi:hypothetical protein